jgi:streptomycin 6-kinase
VILLAELDEAGDANRVAAKILSTLHEPSPPTPPAIRSAPASA